VLVQMLALTAEERRGTLALVRAVGGSRVQLAAVFAGSALAVAALAAPAGILLERYVIGPAVSALAAPYVSLPLAAGAAPIAIVVAAMFAAALAAAGWVARAASSRPIVTALRAE
jgi:ABC-type antimicrobial peptide transport system permease subunit